MTHIHQRIGSAANWAAVNPILQEGEVGWETDTRRSKLGDGVTHWNDLGYTQAGVSITKADVGLGEVDNTSDEDKPVSIAQGARFDAVEADVADLTEDLTALTGTVTTGISDIAAARAKRWSLVTAYPIGAVVGYAGILWRCTTATNPGEAPALFTSKWEPVMGRNADAMAVNDPYFNGDSLTASWSTFWKSGTINSIGLSAAAGDFDGGRQGVKIDMGANAGQQLYPMDESIVNGGETVQMLVRAKVSSGAATVGGLINQSDANVPEPFSAGSVAQAAYEGTVALDGTWRTYTFTFTAVAGKPRCKVSPQFTAGAAGGVVNVAWIRQRKIIKSEGDPFFKGLPTARNQALTGGVNIPFTATEDSHRKWSTTNNNYVIPLPGLYRVTAQVKVDSTYTINGLQLIVNGAVKTYGGNNAAVAYGGAYITDDIRLAAGDTVAVRPQGSDGLQDDGATLENTFFLIEYLRP